MLSPHDPKWIKVVDSFILYNASQTFRESLEKMCQSSCGDTYTVMHDLIKEKYLQRINQ